MRSFDAAARLQNRQILLNCGVEAATAAVVIRAERKVTGAIVVRQAGAEIDVEVIAAMVEIAGIETEVDVIDVTGNSRLLYQPQSCHFEILQLQIFNC